MGVLLKDEDLANVLPMLFEQTGQGRAEVLDEGGSVLVYWAMIVITVAFSPPDGRRLVPDRLFLFGRRIR